MGSSQSSTSAGKVSEPITHDNDEKNQQKGSSSYPAPKGDEYDKLDSLLDTLPKVIDPESQAQIDEYVASCDEGKGPAVACFSTAEYLSLMERDYSQAVKLFENACFRPITDKSPNAVEVDGTMAYPPACFNLAQYRMTGKGRTKFSHTEGYQLFDRACRGGHYGACHLQARMLASGPKAFEDVPYDPRKACELFQEACTEGNDSYSCFTAATMILRGDQVAPEADNVSPGEARGVEEVKMREGETDRRRRSDDERIVLERDPPKAAKLLDLACKGGHSPSCYNLAVMYNIGDDGVPKDTKKSDYYQKKTEEFVKDFGGFGLKSGGNSPSGPSM